MVSNDWYHRVREIDSGKNVSADSSVQFHFFKFCCGQLSGFIQNVFWYCKFSHVMEERRCLNRFKESLVRDADVLCQPNRVCLHTSNVTMCDLILRIDGHRECFDRRQV